MCLYVFILLYTCFTRIYTYFTRILHVFARIYMYFTRNLHVFYIRIIRHRAARHDRACSVHLSGCNSLDIDSLKGPTTQRPGSLALSALLVFTLFASFFRTLIYYNDWYQKVSKWDPQNSNKSQKSGTSR